jgi:hypothetical protein
MKKRIFISFMILFLFSAHSAAEIFKWRDKNGRVHFGDRKVDGVEQVRVELRENKTEWVGFKIEVDDRGANLSDKEKARVEDEVNSVYRFFDKKLYFDIYKTIPVNVRIFGSHKKYKEYIVKESPDLINTRGVYFPRNKQIVLYMRKDREGSFRTLKHETSHAIIRSLTPFVPAWLDEGLAENMETVAVEDGRLYLDFHAENYRNLAKHHEKKRLIGISEFIGLKSSEWRKRNRLSKYILQTQTGELVRLLLSSTQGRSFVIRLVHAYKRGDRTLASRIAEKHYIGGLFSLEMNWEKWKRRERGERISL